MGAPHVERSRGFLQVRDSWRATVARPLPEDKAPILPLRGDPTDHGKGQPGGEVVLCSRPRMGRLERG